MKPIITLATLLVTIAAAPLYASEPIHTSFINSKGESIGTAILTEMENGTLISVNLRLAVGTHAMHLHENGKCDAADFKSAGGHYNPDGHKHGMESKEGFHAGDLPNLYVESTGHIKADIFSSRLHLTGTNALSHGAILIHEKADDYLTDPTGSAGTRIACAVVRP